MALKMPAINRAKVAARIADMVLRYIRRIPSSSEKKSRTPAQAARSRANSAAAKAALAAGSLALPPGPLGWITILPEMAAVWRIQSQMVSDIAAIYGRKSTLTEEQMVYCLFRHSAPQAVRDLIARMGGRVLVKRTSLAFMQTIAKKIGIKLSQKVLGKGLSRWIPVAGALGVGAYAYYDTAQVAATAIDLFAREIEVESKPAE